LLVPLTLSAGVAFILGASAYLQERHAHERAAARLQLARKDSAYARARLQVAADARRLLALQTATTTQARGLLRREELTGFATARESGSTHGQWAGTSAGKRAGTRAGLAQGSNIPAPGWYYVDIEWQNGLPTIGATYHLKTGADRADYIKNGEAWYRQTG
jgi:hypothetical protein